MATKVEKQAIRINDFLQMYSLGKTKLYSLINSGDLRVVKSGRCTLIPQTSIEAWLQRCEAEGARVFGEKRTTK